MPKPSYFIASIDEVFQFTPPPDIEPDEAEAEEPKTITVDACGCEFAEDDCSTCEICGKCNGCCDCWICDGCDKQKPIDASQCSNCGCCSNCCDCYGCEICGSTVSVEDFCGVCDRCYECCPCAKSARKPCVGCDNRSEDRCPECKRCLNCGHFKLCSQSRVAVTQKVRGLQALQSNHKLRSLVLPFQWVAASALVEPLEVLGLKFPAFARPAPKLARHGFVPSRIVYGYRGLRDLACEALAADPNAELILMQPLDAVASAIWVPGALTFGPGNDGATGGRDCTTVPVCGELVSDATRADAGVCDTPYVEVVYDDAGAHLVQLRNGPKIPATQDYLPAPVRVQRVVLADAEDLKARPWDYWENLVASLPQDQGVVVYHRGGALSSHYAVHAVLHGLPVVTSHAPVIGELLEPTVEAAERSVERLREGFAAGLEHRAEVYHSPHSDDDLMEHWRMAAQLMLAACHNAALWQGREDFLLGFGMGLGFRLALVACLGELRHGRNPFRPANAWFEWNSEDTPSRCRPARETIFADLWPRASTSRKRLAVAARYFGDQEFLWAKGFGGTSWHKIAAAAITLHNALCAGDYIAAVEGFNTLVNSVHNSGWAFDKFLTKDQLNLAAGCGAYPAVQAVPLIAAALGAQPSERFRWQAIPLPPVTKAPAEHICDECENTPCTCDTDEPCEECGYVDCQCGEPSSGKILVCSTCGKTPCVCSNSAVPGCNCWICTGKPVPNKAALPECPKCGLLTGSCECEPAAPAPNPTRQAVAAQLKLTDSEVFAQIRYNDGTRRKAFQVLNVSQDCILDAQAVIDNGHTVPSMASGSDTPYVPLDKD